MAFVTLEDLYGTVEIIVFPKDYEKYKTLLAEDNKVLVVGRASCNEEEKGKVVLSRIIPFDRIPRQLWIRFPDKASYFARETELNNILAASDGVDEVVIYCEAEKAKKYLPKNMTVNAEPELLDILYKQFDEKNVKVVDKSIEN